MTFFRYFGTVAVGSDDITFVKAGRTSSVQFKRRAVGIGSRSHVFKDIFIIMLQTTFSDTTSKSVKGHT